jgi:glycosyltransferase involved in cell wall biosynthesis
MKKVLIISNSPLHNSGVANQCRHICKKLCENKFEVIVLAYSKQNPSPPPTLFEFDGIKIKIASTQLDANGLFSDIPMLFKLLNQEQPDILILFDDPHRFLGLLDSAAFIKSKIPLLFIHVWDTYLNSRNKSVPHFNAPIYENFDHISCISHQTKWFVDNVFKTVKHTPQPPTTYVGHGQDPNVFKRIEDMEELDKYRADIFGSRKYDFVCLNVNRNQARKKLPDLIEGWRLFIESLPKAEAIKCALILKTEVISMEGTNLDAVITALAPEHNVLIVPQNCPDAELNKLYNISDVIINNANAGGFELNINQGMLCEKPIIATVCGGMVDQMGFNRAGAPFVWTEDNFRELNTKREYTPGNWVYPLYGQRTIIGSPNTPYLYDYNASIDDIAAGLHYWHSTTPERRAIDGKAGREYCLKMGITSEDFADAVVQDIGYCLDNFKPNDNMFRVFKL